MKYDFGTVCERDMDMLFMNTFVLLHHFHKKTQKTPAAEIEKAKRELEDYKRRYE